MKRNVIAAGLVCIIAAFVLLPATPCFALVTGTVKDTIGSPVSGALVTFTDESNSENEYSAYTDEEGKYSITVTPVSINEETPANFQLYQNYPNPFNPSTTIPFSLKEAGIVNLSIYNVTGQKVRTLVDNFHSVGSHTVTWNGLDNSGKSVSAGIYIYQFKFGDTVESKKMLLIDGGSSSNFIGSNKIVAQTNVIAKSVSDAGNSTYLVTITGDNIESYEESGVTIVDGETYDFVVVRKTFEIHSITFVTIPGGTFEMGEEVGSLQSVCWPVHTVTVSDFDMSTTEITNAHYAVYLNKAQMSGDIYEPSEGNVSGKTGDFSGQKYIYLSGSHILYPQNECWIRYKDNMFVVEAGYENWPVVWITWYGAKAFALYYGFDLPTEAEWEYAARGGKHYKFGTDDGTISTNKANYVISDIEHPVNARRYRANPFGLYDLSGNIWEWCNDWYEDYSSDSATDPTGAQTGSRRVVRGGSCVLSTQYCQTAYRNDSYPVARGSFVGFRVVRRTSPLN